MRLSEDPVGLSRQEPEQRLSKCAGMSRNDDSDLRHLPATVRARLVMDDHHVVAG
jgi:hypothetical protein